MSSRHWQRGITLLEALIALLVLAFGLLTFAALQARLRINSDIAKQRTEAVRIAQEDLENFRAFGTLAADAGVANNFAYSQIATAAAQKTVDASDVSTATNTTYTLTRSIVNDPVADLRDLQIRVSWTDRENVNQQVTLRSFIAGIDPLLAAKMAIAPNGSPVRDPLGRDVQVPIPAKNLGDGTSVFKPSSGATTAYVFNNDTGYITKRCTAVPSTTYTQSISTADLPSYNCVDLIGNAYLLSGYIRFSYLSNNPDADTPNDPPPAGGSAGIRLDLDDTAPATGTQGSAGLMVPGGWPALNAAADTSGYTTPECGSEYSKTVAYSLAVNYSQTNNGSTTTQTSASAVAIVPAATANTAAALSPFINVAAANISNVTDTGERFVSYTCVIYPVNLDADITTQAAWTGRSAVTASGWTIGTATGQYKVCRYSADYNLNGVQFTTSGGNVTRIDNAEHHYAYLNVMSGLSNQNFLVIASNKTCPTDGAVEVNGQGGENYTDTTTVTHQP